MKLLRFGNFPGEMGVFGFAVGFGHHLSESLHVFTIGLG